MTKHYIKPLILLPLSGEMPDSLFIQHRPTKGTLSYDLDNADELLSTQAGAVGEMVLEAAGWRR